MASEDQVKRGIKNSLYSNFPENGIPRALCHSKLATLNPKQNHSLFINPRDFSWNFNKKKRFEIGIRRFFRQN
jgi:hypothetical protein